MIVYVDADACPVTRIVEEMCMKYSVKCVLMCDTNHVLTSDYSELVTVCAGADAVDFALVNKLRSGDIVVTQDYGVAAMALAKGASAIHQSGMEYTSENIDALLMERHVAKEARRSKKRNHVKGPSKRTNQDDMAFSAAFDSILASRTAL